MLQAPWPTARSPGLRSDGRRPGDGPAIISGGRAGVSLSHRHGDGKTLRDVRGVYMDGIVIECTHSCHLEFLFWCRVAGLCRRGRVQAEVVA
jgi:hypothetical protein